MSIYADFEKRLGNFCLSVKIEAHDEVLALLGASGCGKSMTLKCIAGIERPDKGKIVIDDVTVFDSKKHINLSPQKRRTGFLFQNYALFPNMTVIQNLRLGARRNHNKEQREQEVQRALDAFSLRPLQNHLPSQLSGGQQQRTALARILLSEPRILMLDEPFSALDSHLKFRLEQEVSKIMRDFGKTVLLVSHNRDEVYRLADRIAIMTDGVIDIVGQKENVFTIPQTKTSAQLIGIKNIQTIDRLLDGTITIPNWNMHFIVDNFPDDASYIGLRMGDIEYGKGDNEYNCTVEGVTENPSSMTIFLKPLGATDILYWEISKEKWQFICNENIITIHIPIDTIIPLR